MRLGPVRIVGEEKVALRAAAVGQKAGGSVVVFQREGPVHAPDILLPHVVATPHMHADRSLLPESGDQARVGRAGRFAETEVAADLVGPVGKQARVLPGALQQKIARRGQQTRVGPTPAIAKQRPAASSRSGQPAEDLRQALAGGQPRCQPGAPPRACSVNSQGFELIRAIGPAGGDRAGVEQQSPASRQCHGPAAGILKHLVSQAPIEPDQHALGLVSHGILRKRIPARLRQGSHCHREL